ncbi:SpoIIE family protein phosphatase [Nocardiopsis sp. NRRL B-16309]|uniref:ATP-binding SpoIIE family protein phosphatase n=1 Tax=Nocardiopsis sp. NRRL B-16309 TaxID=1519494 RepID=UPI0006B02660|nr:SpoIIE family protein phosphatase [Nocardiopsis sp. NRRL B-16309]
MDPKTSDLFDAARESVRERTAVLERVRFLNEAATRIGASMDMRKIVRELVGAVVPHLADAATVHLLDALLPGPHLDVELPDAVGSLTAPLRRVAVVHSGYQSDLWRTVVPEDQVHVMPPSNPVHRAMAEAAPVVVPRIDDEIAAMLDRTHTTGDLTPLILGRSLLALPLTVRGRVLGAVVLLRDPDRALFDEVDTLMAEQLAIQTGLALDNAHMYRSEADATDALQRAMLPALPPRLSCADIAHRYRSSSHIAQVGGDWFDAIPLSGSRVVFVVGDVMGHGLHSAAAMGQFRTAVQTLAALDLPPEQVLRHLDDLALRLGEDYLATCLYCVYDPVARLCTMANAGHIPPVLVRQGRGAEPVRLPTGAPIGLGGVAFESADVRVHDGDVLLLCTDGLVEARGRDIEKGMAALCAAAERPLPLEELGDTILADLHTDDQEDDVALLLARLRGVPSRHVAHWLMEPRPTTPSRVRRLIRATLASWELEELTDVAELLATELVTNAVRYASGPIGVRLLRTDALLFEVSDEDQHRPVLRRAADTDEGGRGLQLVSRLAKRWGASGKTPGKVVWFELDLDGG